MKLTKSQLKKLIKEEIQLGKVYTFKDKPPFKTNEEQLTEAPSVIEKDEAGWYINEALEDLETAIKKIKNPEDWAEKYTRSLPKLIETIDGLIKVFGRMK